MLNYAVDPALLRASVPAGTELDSFEGKTYVSLVGFRFLRTRVRGIWFPFHSDFDEVNLRFYVRCGDRRGVVFIREIVPRYAIAAVARMAFQEKYIALPMRHRLAGPVSEGGRISVEYAWRRAGAWSSIRMECSGQPAPAAEGSLQQFITEHYWGYATQRRGAGLEYEVGHVPWRVWNATASRFEGDVAGLYGAGLAAGLSQEPDSAFLADGSSVVVYGGRRLA
jgi:uncharacterized protein YqjF (DUF2071 family)